MQTAPQLVAEALCWWNEFHRGEELPAPFSDAMYCHADPGAFEALKKIVNWWGITRRQDEQPKWLQQATLMICDSI